MSLCRLHLCIAIYSNYPCRSSHYPGYVQDDPSNLSMLAFFMWLSSILYYGFFYLILSHKSFLEASTIHSFLAFKLIGYYFTLQQATRRYQKCSAYHRCISRHNRGQPCQRFNPSCPYSLDRLLNTRRARHCAALLDAHSRKPSVLHHSSNSSTSNRK
ncbi:MAG: hypothetical protein JOS17DRAFT_391318 [Linnemannia elongata]|nr:MAG: hypothetical protein JOS17DRAFT_391318 [Linnemannia elongata]